MSKTYDPTGLESDNYVQSELHGITNSISVWPQEGPFFLKGLHVTAVHTTSGVLTTLRPLEDLVLSPMFITATVAVHQAIYSYFVLLAPNDYHSVRVTYHALGGLTDEVLTNEIAAATYDPLIFNDYLQFRGEAATVGNAGAVATNTVNWLELVNGGMDAVIAQLQVQSEGSIEQQVYNNTDSNRAQDLLIAGLTTSSSSQDTLLRVIGGIIDLLNAYDATIAVVNAEQDAAIAANTILIAELIADGQANNDATNELIALVAANTLRNAKQNAILPINTSTIVPQNNLINGLLNRIQILTQLAGDAITIDALWVLQNANTAPLVLADSGSDAVVVRNVTQDGILDGLTTDLSGAEQTINANSVINLAAMQADVTRTDVHLDIITPAALVSETLDPIQTGTNEGIDARILALQQYGTGVDTAPVVVVMDETDDKTDALEGENSNAASINQQQDTRLLAQEAIVGDVREHGSDVDTLAELIRGNEQVLDIVDDLSDAVYRAGLEQRRVIDDTASKIASFSATGTLSINGLLALIIRNTTAALGLNTRIQATTAVNARQDVDIAACRTANNKQGDKLARITAKVEGIARSTKPSILTPPTQSTVPVNEHLVLTSSPYTTKVADAHASSSWSVARDPEHTIVVEEHISDSDNLESITLETLIPPGITVYIRVQHHGFIYDNGTPSDNVIVTGGELAGATITTLESPEDIVVNDLVLYKGGYLLAGTTVNQEYIADDLTTYRGYVLLLDSAMSLRNGTAIAFPFRIKYITHIADTKYIIVGDDGTNGFFGIAEVPVSGLVTFGGDYTEIKGGFNVSKPKVVDGRVYMLATGNRPSDRFAINNVLHIDSTGTLISIRTFALDGLLNYSLEDIAVIDSDMYIVGYIRVTGQTLNGLIIKCHPTDPNIVAARTWGINGTNNALYPDSTVAYRDIFIEAHGDRLVVAGTMSLGLYFNADATQVFGPSLGYIFKASRDLDMKISLVLDVDDSIQHTVVTGLSLESNSYLVTSRLGTGSTADDTVNTGLVTRMDTNLTVESSVELGSQPGNTVVGNMVQDTSIVCVGYTDLVNDGQTTGLVFKVARDLKPVDGFALGTDALKVTKHVTPTAVMHNAALIDLVPSIDMVNQNINDVVLVEPRFTAPVGFSTTGLAENTINPRRY